MADLGEDADGVVVPLRPRAEPARSHRHAHPSAQDAPDGPGATVMPFGDVVDVLPAPQPPAPQVSRAVAALDFVRERLAGRYEVDEYGFDPALTDAVTLPVLRTLYQRWFRTEVNGLEHLPARGGALLVANHAGGLWPLDAAMTAVATRVEAGRPLRVLADPLVFRLPLAGTFARRSGATLSCADDAERLLRAGELVGSWPELHGGGKKFRDRYLLRGFDAGPVVVAAAAAGVPVVPVSIVGAEEAQPVLGDARLLARLLDVPHLPITPTFPLLGPLGLVPLPSKWYLEFGAPMPTAGVDPGDVAAVSEFADAVRDEIQLSLYRLLGQRRSVWR